MKLLPTTLGADRKKVLILCGLLAILGVVYLINRTSGPDASPQAASVSSAAPTAPKAAAPAGGPRAINATASAEQALTAMPPQRESGNRRGQESVQDFKLSMKPPEGTELSRIDPTIHLDLLAKLQQLPLEGGSRNLFDFGAAPPPPKPPPSVQPIKPQAPPVISDGPPPAPPKPIVPPPPPIPLKFYGFVNGSVGGARTAFFLEGDDIYVAGENDLVHNRYKIIRIGVNSAVVEDTTTKNQQTLPLVEELPG